MQTSMQQESLAAISSHSYLTARDSAHFPTRGREEEKKTLSEECALVRQGTPDAFKDLMIHWILQFALRIAFRCVLHRYESQDIRC
jgi:hypothetical protein